MVGTAVVVTPIDTIGINGVDYKLPAYTDSNMLFKIKNMLDAMRYGTA